MLILGRQTESGIDSDTESPIPLAAYQNCGPPSLLRSAYEPSSLWRKPTASQASPDPFLLTPRTVGRSSNMA